MFRLLSLSLLLISLNAHSSVWVANKSWSDFWEFQYQNWVAQNWSHEFFLKKGTPYSDLQLDCADTIYSMRIIFSYENQLPIAFKDPTGGKKPITNEMNRWDNLSQNEKIRNFLKYIYQVLGSDSVIENSYPIAINRESIVSGKILSADAKANHGYTIKEVDQYGIPHLVYSSMPARTDILYSFGIPPSVYLFPKGLNESGGGGFRAFRQPQELNLPEFKIPKYSNEQYTSFSEKNWANEIQRRIALTKESPDQRLQRVSSDICRMVYERVDIVNKAGAANQSKAGECLDDSSFEGLSTPSRDKRLKLYFQELGGFFYQSINEDPKSIPNYQRKQLEAILEKFTPEIDSTSFCPVYIAPNKALTLGTVYLRLLTGQTSPDPNDSFERRWGEVTETSLESQSCPKP